MICYAQNVGLQRIAYAIACNLLQERFARGLRNLHQTARVTVEQSVLAITEIRNARQRVEPSICRINSIAYSSTEIRFMSLVAGEMRARKTVRKLAASRRTSTSNR